MYDSKVSLSNHREIHFIRLTLYIYKVPLSYITAVMILEMQEYLFFLSHKCFTTRKYKYREEICNLKRRGASNRYKTRIRNAERQLISALNHARIYLALHEER